MESPILNLFLLVLGIPLNLSLDANHKSGKFTKVLPKKGLEFILNRRNNIIAFKLGLMLLPMEVNLILEK